MSKLSRSVGLLSGFLLSYTLSEPNLPIKSKFPEKSFKNIEITPNLEIKRKDGYYHIHHWLYFSFAYVALITYRGNFKGKKFINGLVLGLIVQGLSYRDRFQFRDPTIPKLTKD
jgi:hypothetical protein